jgi:hypothetical protein
MTYNIGSGIGLREHVASVGGGHDEIRDDGNGLDLGGPFKLSVVTNSQRGLRGLEAGINATSRSGQDFTEWDLFPRHVLGLQLVEIGTHKASE